jgi:glutathione gamma-glutamylcysteinyltransferase
MATTGSFYRRPLPEALIEFASPAGRSLFGEALAAGTMEGYFALAEQFHTQSEPSFCGLGTLVIVLNALAIDPGRAWRGPWRWFGEEMLDCCRPLDVVKEKGITFPQLVCLARCNGARVEATRASDATLEQLRDAARRASRSSGEPHLVVSYDRSALGQTGSGHFSPIAGFHEASDRVLVLDVARFKYPPHWVPVKMLWQAMLPIDPVTGKSRGFFELSRAGDVPPTVLSMVCAENEKWPAAAAALSTALPDALTEAGTTTEAGATELTTVLAGILKRVSPAVFATLVVPTANRSAEEPAREEVLAALRATPLFGIVRTLDRHEPDGSSPELATLMLLALPPSVFPRAPGSTLERCLDTGNLPPAVRAEVLGLRAQIAALVAYCDDGVSPAS